ncbi:MAG: DUF2607 family protein [Nitrospinae bacterium]|nr:DUF2607 family protein [Nitrospinota bacterium]
MKKTLTAYLLILTLGVLLGFSSVLHSHELDLHDDHEDCFSCEWSQVSLDTSPSLPEISSSIIEAFHPLASDTPAKAILFTAFLSRAPPAFSVNISIPQNPKTTA